MELPDDLRAAAERFVEVFGGQRPQWVARVPGRINLIGEHTDYNGFPVLPMAIGRAIRIAAGPRDDGRVELHDVASMLYGDRSFEVAATIPKSANGDWCNYVKAGVQSMVGLALHEGRELSSLKGMSCLVDGDVPPGAGLSSSSALVVSAGLAFGAVNHLSCGRHDMAERMAQAEHYVGTQGGGMDQAAVLLGRAGEVLKIDFFPLRAMHVPFPEDYCIVAAHSTVQARKTAEHRLAFNRRVLECRVGVAMLARKLAMDRPASLAELSMEVTSPSIVLPALMEEDLEGRESLSLRRAAILFDTDPGRFTREHLRLADGQLLPMPGDGLRVLQRCRHVLTEAERVEHAVECLKNGDMKGLGKLMDESHASCARDYEVSCYELDQLVNVLRRGGALGARLTGAGFGGFAIALVPRERVASVVAAAAEKFYQPRGIASDGNVFVFSPADGAVEEPVP